MKTIKKVVNWAAQEIQKSLGEEERRNQISLLKQLAIEFKQKTTAAVEALNKSIQDFNESIRKLNSFRIDNIQKSLEVLHTFLLKFGNCKAIDAYVEESEQIPKSFPEKDFDEIGRYINKIDWSQDEVFLKTFLLSPIGMKHQTRQQNLSMREHIHELQLQTEATLQELHARQLSADQEIEISKLYLSNIKFISQVISECIIPELDLIEAFCQAEKIKNEIICEHKLSEIKFSYDTKCLAGTSFAKHHQFIKNTVLFYVLSCKIYSTPVLTNLLHNKTSRDDILRLQTEHDLLDVQAQALDNNMVVKRKAIT